MFVLGIVHEEKETSGFLCNKSVGVLSRVTRHLDFQITII